MIKNYYRPTDLEAAIELLAKPNTIPLGGGTYINTPYFVAAQLDDFSVVDLQAVGLNLFEQKGSTLHLGATLTLQAMLDVPGLWPALGEAIRHETTYNLRQMSTLAGALVACDGRSSFATAMLSLDAQLSIRNNQKTVISKLGDFLPLRPIGLITEIRLPIKAKLAFEVVARTPADRPIVCAAVAQWPSGRTRVALGGWGVAPLLAMDGPEAVGAEVAAHAVYSQASDQWASAEYRAEIAEVLTRRALQVISAI